MVLKRKRSESEFSFSSGFSSPSRPGTTNFDFGAMETEDWGVLGSRASTPSHLHSRTMKRHRDNRPSDGEVHQRTLNLLYSAQQQRQHRPIETHIQPEAVAAAPCNEVQTRRDGQQRSLHSFWNKLLVTASSSAAPSAAPSTALSPVAKHQNMSTFCEDCGAPFSDGADVMNLDGSGVEDHICSACGKAVCLGCSTSNLGDRRRCLTCAGQRV